MEPVINELRIAAPRGFAGDPEEAELVALAQRNPTAFAPLYDRYFTLVFRYCYRRLGHPEDAADATAIVFSQALAALSRYRRASFRSWLFAIAHNVVVDFHRVRGRHPESPLAAADHLSDDSREGSPELSALAADSRRTLIAALSHLSEDQRRIVEYRLAGLTTPEIADLLDRSVGAVKITQHRAYARLRLLLAPPLPSAPPISHPAHLAHVAGDRR